MIKKILFILLNIITIKKTYQQPIFTGDGTIYGGVINSGFCNLRDTSFNYNGNLGVALNLPQFNNSLNCGSCVSIQYNNREPVIAIVTDLCPECKFGDLDMFTETYKTVIDEDPGRKIISWKFINCPNNYLSNPTIQLRIDQINQYWLNLVPSNFKCSIANIEINFSNGWQNLQRNDNIMTGLNFNWNSYVSVPFQLRLTSSKNDVIITDKYYKLENLLETDQQFKCNKANTISNTPSITPSNIKTPSPSNTISPPDIINVINTVLPNGDIKSTNYYNFKKDC
jgi:expansin (peptidoglycan-binding protein)